jgi:SAM-dependent methyltransferase
VGIKLPRKKTGNVMLSVLYRMHNYFPLGRRSKFKLYLNLEWIFDRLSHEMSFNMYDPDKHPVRLRSREFILQQITDKSVVLDLGCNRGEIANIIAEKAAEVVGIDYLEPPIKFAQERYKRPNLTFVHTEALDYLGKNAHRFDTLILSHILEHLDEPEAFLMRFKNHFQWIYIELPDFDRHYLNQYRQDLGLKLVYTDDDHVSEFDRYELNELLQRCNIEVVRSEYIYGLQKLWCKVV